MPLPKPPPRVLEYSSRPAPWDWRASVRRWRVREMGVVLVVAGVYYAWVGPWLADVALSRRYARFTMPESLIVYDEGTVIGPGLVAARPGEYRRAFGNLASVYVNPVWRGRLQAPIAFLHERKAASGPRRLVNVVLELGDDVHSVSNFNRGRDYHLSLHFTALTARIGSPTGADERHAGTLEFPVAGITFRLYAGQADPDDDAHFTFAYEIDGEPGTIDGRLLRDCTVKLGVRDGPATRPGLEDAGDPWATWRWLIGPAGESPPR